MYEGIHTTKSITSISKLFLFENHTMAFKGRDVDTRQCGWANLIVQFCWQLKKPLLNFNVLYNFTILVSRKLASNIQNTVFVVFLGRFHHEFGF